MPVRQNLISEVILDAKQIPRSRSGRLLIPRLQHWRRETVVVENDTLVLNTGSRVVSKWSEDTSLTSLCDVNNISLLPTAGVRQKKGTDRRCSLWDCYSKAILEATLSEDSKSISSESDFNTFSKRDGFIHPAVVLQSSSNKRRGGSGKVNSTMPSKTTGKASRAQGNRKALHEQCKVLSNDNVKSSVPVMGKRDEDVSAWKSRLRQGQKINYSENSVKKRWRKDTQEDSKENEDLNTLKRRLRQPRQKEAAKESEQLDEDISTVKRRRRKTRQKKDSKENEKSVETLNTVKKRESVSPDNVRTVFKPTKQTLDSDNVPEDTLGDFMFSFDLGDNSFSTVVEEAKSRKNIEKEVVVCTADTLTVNDVKRTLKIDTQEETSTGIAQKCKARGNGIGGQGTLKRRIHNEQKLVEQSKRLAAGRDPIDIFSIPCAAGSFIGDGVVNIVPADLTVSEEFSELGGILRTPGTRPLTPITQYVGLKPSGSNKTTPTQIMSPFSWTPKGRGFNTLKKLHKTMQMKKQKRNPNHHLKVKDAVDMPKAVQRKRLTKFEVEMPTINSALQQLPTDLRDKVAPYAKNWSRISFLCSNEPDDSSEDKDYYFSECSDSE